MKTTLARTLAVAMLTALPVFSFAHEGHGSENPLSPGHFLSNPEHAVPLAMSVVAAIGAYVVYRILKARQQKIK
jgi:hypothetical protein